MSEDEHTTTSSPRTGTKTDSPTTCDTCGSPIDAEEWHPTATEWDEDGDLTVYTFCSPECRDARDRA